MSQENVDAMRAALEAFNRRDTPAFARSLARDAEIVPARAAIEGVYYRGPEAAYEYCAAVEETWDGLSWDVEEIRDGGSWVIALGRIQGRGRNSGVDIDALGAWVAHFRKGLITSFQTYSDRAQALEVVGLEQ